MEEFQLVFAQWLLKFIAVCAVALITLRWIDRRWRRGKVTDITAKPPLTLAMSRRRARS